MKTRKLLAGAIAALALSVANSAAADTIYSFTTGTNGNANQSATATFDFVTANHLVLTLADTGNIVDIAGILDDFHFLLSAPVTSVTYNAITTPGGSETCVTDQTTKVVTCTNDPNTNELGTWSIFNSGGSINMYADPNGGTSLHPYGIVNPSFITNASLDGLTNAQHNPVLMGPTTFDITFVGLTAIPTISQVVFSFGTTPDLIPGTPRTVPEPATLVLLGLGLVGFAWVRRFKH